MNASRTRIEPLAAVAYPLDVVRAALLRVLGRPGRVFLARRSARVGLYAAIGLLSSLVVALTCPVWAFALGPIVLGIPHLVSDVRYLVIKPGLHRRTALAASVSSLLVLSTFTQNTAVGLSAGLAAIVFAKSSTALKKTALFALWSVVVALAAYKPRASALILVHGHNAVAVLLFLVAFARSRRVGIVIGLATAAVTLGLLGGAFDSIMMHASMSGPKTALDLSGILDSVSGSAGSTTNPVFAMRLAILFVFAQGFHYVLWLRVIPEEARERAGIRSFASSLRALDGDFGRLVLIAAVLGMIALAARASISLEAARMLYLKGAMFHGSLEIAFVILLILEGRPAK